MKAFTPLNLFVAVAILFVSALSGDAFAQAGGSGGGVANVKPGETHPNGDVVVQNNAGERARKRLSQEELAEQPEGASNGNAQVDPRTVSGSQDSTVTLNAGFHGEVTGLDEGDTVEVGNKTGTTIEGEGGHVNLIGASASTTTITNTNTGKNDPHITVSLPGGGSTSVPPNTTLSYTYP